MKKLCVILSILFFCGQIVFADETAVTEDMSNDVQTVSNQTQAAAEMSSDAAPASANQEITATENKVVFTVQKCPMNENANQKIVLKKNWFVVFVQVNGKVKETEAE